MTSYGTRTSTNCSTLCSSPGPNAPTMSTKTSTRPQHRASNPGVFNLDDVLRRMRERLAKSAIARFFSTWEAGVIDGLKTGDRGSKINRNYCWLQGMVHWIWLAFDLDQGNDWGGGGIVGFPQEGRIYSWHLRSGTIVVCLLSTEIWCFEELLSREGALIW